MTIMFKGFVFASFADVFVVATNVRNATNEVVMSKSNVVEFVSGSTISFSPMMQERLEEILISMLDSGTITEGVAMAINECDNERSVRRYNEEIGVDNVNIILDYVFSRNRIIADADTTNVDLSEFFTCKTPEEARNLQSWAEAFGSTVTIKPALSVVEDDCIPF